MRRTAIKAWLGGGGLVLGLAGMALERREVVWAAVALLITAFLLRWGGRGDPP